MKPCIFPTAVLIAVGLVVAVPSISIAQETAVLETFVATEYVNGGVGEASQERMQRIGHEYPLRMVFSERTDGEFIVDVPVYIMDAKGNLVFALAKAGPMLDVALPNGKYKVSAQFKGLTEYQNVTLDGKDGKDLYFHWKGKP